LTEPGIQEAAPAHAGAASGATELPAVPGSGAPVAHEQTRARYPDKEGYVERDGVRLFYEVYGAGEPTVMLLPTWSIIHSRFWKAQIPYLARHFRVVTFDGRGTGRSDRPVGAEAYSTTVFAQDTLAVMDATNTPSAVLVACSCGALWGTIVAAEHPDRVEAIAYIGPSVNLAPGHPEREVFPFERELAETEGWAKYNAAHWRRDYLDFLEFFFAKCFNEPHSSKQIEDCIGWALETTPETLADTTRGIGVPTGRDFSELCTRVRCPTLVIHGDADQVRPHAQGAALAAATGGRLVTLEGGGHLPMARDPVRVNLLLGEFIGRGASTSAWRRARARGRRALYISSPIGLGHARRDVAIAQELRRLHPDLQIDWLAQDPVTRVLEDRGERIHPASAQLANESGHFESESAEHDLHCFHAWRRMDEILIANFMVFDDLVREEQYDLWIGDEAWELDYYLHENPELKRSAYVWLTDFVGWLPMPDGGQREAALTADYNAEMIEQVERYPRVRDRAVFVGERDDIVPEDFGDGLPAIREWTERHYSFTGYVTGFDPAAFADREALRRELGYGRDELVCIVTVGGSGVGADLLRTALESYAEAKRLVPELRMIAVAGPRIDPSSLPSHRGLEVRAFVPDLYRHLAACDLAVVQGGLTTAMELTANSRPFIYFPLGHHFEQSFHVHHRLQRHGAGRRMDFEATGPAELASAIAQEIGREVDYMPVTTDGAARAAALIGELL
jgi:pimeloyl-ACP methyl ester carboxylesterase/predicted glycosyltransferase